ncbi:MAG: two-component sensor histidine kinase [Variovorax sp.]|nr:MAG: two-component sensor histidine kinase [Variovorax sp.]
MKKWLRAQGGWWLAWLALSVAGAAWLARAELAQLQQDFETDARIAHRLMSQQVVQYDAVLATLALLQPGAADAARTPEADVVTDAPAARPEQRLASVYPSILRVQRREDGGAWPDGPNAAAYVAAETASRQRRRAALAMADLPNGRYALVIGATPVSYALDIDLASTVHSQDWPMDRAHSPVRVAIEHAGQSWTLQPGRPIDGGWRFGFRKELASSSQAFDVVATRDVGWRELPWRWMAGWALAMAALLFGASALQRQRVARRRAEELLRLGQVARLNSLGELSAGLAHELNQPLTAVLANTQAARRLLEDEPPDLATARGAMTKAVEQARRAADVVGRLRRVIERPDAGGDARPLVLQEVVRNALHLLAPEFVQRGVVPQFDAAAQAPVRVQAEAVALEQIVHNLLMNALQSLDKVPASERHLSVSVVRNGTEGVLNVTDTGTGIAPEALPRLFEPFFSTREGGLGLGLSLSETLASGMGGSLSAANTAARGARFTLLLPLVATAEGRA